MLNYRPGKGMNCLDGKYQNEGLLSTGAPPGLIGRPQIGPMSLSNGPDGYGSLPHAVPVRLLIGVTLACLMSRGGN